MSGRAKFVHWLISPFENEAVDPIASEPMFNVIENDKGMLNGSTVTGDALLKIYGIPLPLFPSRLTWEKETGEKRRCFRCWRVVRGQADLTKHREKVHGEVFKTPPSMQRAWQYMPIILLSLLTMTGCNGVRHLLGIDRHDAQQVDVPITRSLIRQLPASGEVSFGNFPESYISETDTVHVYVKNADWLTASPGAWYEIDIKTDFDVSIATEYVVISYLAQSAHVYNQPAPEPRAIVVHSVPKGAFDPGRPGQ